MKPHILSTVLAFGILGCSQMIRADSFLYSNGTFTPINVPGVSSRDVNVTGINNSGEIVGYTTSGVFPFTQYSGFLDNHGTFSNIIGPGFVAAQPFGINDRGQIVGDLPRSGNAFVQTNGVSSVIPVTGPAVAYAINNAGEIVGDYAMIGFLYANGAVTNIFPPGLGFSITFPTAINNAGQIAGYYITQSGFIESFHGFLDINGSFTTFDLPPGFPGSLHTVSAINDAGQIVGTYTTGSQMHGFLYANGVLTTIDAPGAVNTELFGINNAGQIVGTSNNVPEPASLFAVSFGLAALGLLIHRKRKQIGPVAAGCSNQPNSLS